PLLQLGGVQLAIVVGVERLKGRLVEVDILCPERWLHSFRVARQQLLRQDGKRLAGLEYDQAGLLEVSGTGVLGLLIPERAEADERGADLLGADELVFIHVELV